MSAQPTNRSSYMPQLDSLRALAVSAVLVHHLLGREYLPSFVSDLSLGYLGVRLFFVLSGFLITGILLQARSFADTTNESRMLVVRQFYIRRFLRIFPLYYVVIFIALFAGMQEAHDDWPWLITYTYNIHLSIEGWYPEHFAHFWSLSVEEQFYLLWPWLVLLAPRRALIPLIALLILVAPLYRLYAITHDFNGIAIYVLSLSSFDALGIGSLLAIVSERGTLRSANLLSRWMLLVGLIVLVSLSMTPWKGKGIIAHICLYEFAVAMVFGWLVLSAANSFQGAGGKLLESRSLVYMGKISYGIYVYHLLVPPVVRAVFDALGIEVEYQGPTEFVTMVASTLAVSAVSWHVFERPLNNLKRFFRYSVKDSNIQPTEFWSSTDTKPMR